MTDFDNVGTIGNSNKYSTNQAQTVLLQPSCVCTLPVKTKNSTKTANRLLQRVLLNGLFKTFAESRSMFAFLSLFVRNFFSCLLAENILHTHGFYQKIICKLNMVNFCTKDKTVVMCDVSQL